MLFNVTQCISLVSMPFVGQNGGYQRAGENTRPHQLCWSDLGMGTALSYNKSTQEAHHINIVGPQ